LRSLLTPEATDRINKKYNSLGNSFHSKTVRHLGVTNPNNSNMFGHINMITSEDQSKHPEATTKLFNLVGKHQSSEVSTNHDLAHPSRPKLHKDSSMVNDKSDQEVSFHLLKDNEIFRSNPQPQEIDSETKLPIGPKSPSNPYHADYLQYLNTSKMFGLHFKQAVSVQKKNIDKLDTIQDDNTEMISTIKERISTKLHQDHTKLGFLRKDKFLDTSKKKFFKNKNMDFRSVIKNDKIRSNPNVRNRHIMVICFSRAVTRYCSLEHGFFERLNGDKGRRYFNESECARMTSDFLRRVQEGLKISEGYQFMYTKEGKPIKDIIGFSKENWILLLSNVPDFKGKNWESETVCKKDMDVMEKMAPG
jgi:hypothetical protein